MAKMKVQLKKSPIGSIEKHRRTVEALGLRKIGQTVEVEDNAAMRGMVERVRHMVEIVK